MTAETLRATGMVTRMSARRAVVAVAVLISLTAAAAVFIGQASSTERTPDAEAINSGPSVRRVVPFTLPELRPDRGEVALAAVPGKPTVMNFFAAWCAPCKRELPALREAAASNPEVAFVGVDYKDSREDAIELLDRFGIAYPAGFDPTGDVASKYLLRAMPSTVFIAADGRVVEVHQGELSPAELQTRLDRLTLRKPAT